MAVDPELRDAAKVSKAWPYEEARKLLKRYPDGPGERGIVFETGYGPSGLPHLGTFQEVARTLMVRHALTELVDWPSRLIAFSDDMDGMRKVPPGVPHQDMMHEHLDQPLSRVPDPFGCGHDSYADHNNGLLRQFLDRFGFDYEFLASSDCYRSGRFDETLKAVLRNYDAIMGVMLPTLGEERRQTYSPVLPVSPKSGSVLQVPVELLDPEQGLIAFEDEGERIEQSILSGGAKLQWKVDWAMRWVALGVDYEMSGKDLIDSVTQSSKIARILGARPPDGLQLRDVPRREWREDLQDQGQRRHHRRMADLCARGEPRFLHLSRPAEGQAALFLGHPQGGRRILPVPRRLSGPGVDKKLGNPVHHVHAGEVPPARMPVSFALLLNLVAVASTDDKDLLWGFVKRYCPEASPETHPELDALIDFALAYFRDFIAGSLRKRPPSDVEAAALRDLDERLVAPPGGCRRRDHPGRGLRGRQGAPVRESARLVQGALRDIARHQPGTPHGQLRRALRDRQQPQADRRGAGNRLKPFRCGRSLTRCRDWPGTTRSWARSTFRPAP